MSVLKKASKTPRKPKSGGDGKRRKVFAETKGTAHLIELSNTIAESQNTKLKERIEKARDKAKWVKEKRAQSLRTKSETGAMIQEKRGEKMLLSKSSIRADLLAKRREKTKRRKEARKISAVISAASPQIKQTGKRVSFA